MTAPSVETQTSQSSALAALERELGLGAASHSSFRGLTHIFVRPDRLIEVMTVLKDKASFQLCSDVGGVDYLGYPGRTGPRFEVVYVLVNLDLPERVIVRMGVADSPEPRVPTVTALWPGADWMEREVYDMYGIIFEGHPDLRRILMPDEFTAFPLRKDYPLRGRGERHNFPKLSRAES